MTRALNVRLAFMFSFYLYVKRYLNSKQIINLNIDVCE